MKIYIFIICMLLTFPFGYLKAETLKIRGEFCNVDESGSVSKRTECELIIHVPDMNDDGMTVILQPVKGGEKEIIEFPISKVFYEYNSVADEAILYSYPKFDTYNKDHVLLGYDASILLKSSKSFVFIEVRQKVDGFFLAKDSKVWRKYDNETDFTYLGICPNEELGSMIGTIFARYNLKESSVERPVEKGDPMEPTVRIGDIKVFTDFVPIHGYYNKSYILVSLTLDVFHLQRFNLSAEVYSKSTKIASRTVDCASNYEHEWIFNKNILIPYEDLKNCSEGQLLEIHIKCSSGDTEINTISEVTLPKVIRYEKQ